MRLESLRSSTSLLRIGVAFWAVIPKWTLKSFTVSSLSASVMKSIIFSPRARFSFWVSVSSPDLDLFLRSSSSISWLMKFTNSAFSATSGMLSNATKLSLLVILFVIINPFLASKRNLTFFIDVSSSFCFSLSFLHTYYITFLYVMSIGTCGSLR